ncbi:hypothetical protein PRIPAC_79396 [Pristionchus pacificus]|uniref:Uncharacterized protein n=1 Tax=Pristionchus pacificus TaxID=54126 RepID=A0A2A6CPS4_PRIPA|nr:hypothetical protein PRIPAC_79396 [Pristionchus pacificus]|eukprot:PDM80041.1 hypothetical protein PRIPAC_32620 [Pristionchus pacificus]
MANPTGVGAKDMADNMENATGACVTRTMIWKRRIHRGAAYINQIGGTPGVNTQVYPFTCNADGETWSIPGVVPTITGVQCAALP